MNENLSSVFQKLNIDVFGVTSAEKYNSIMKTDYKSAIVALFPYYCGEDDNSPLSIYTHGKDYHIVIRDILTQAARQLGLENYDVRSDVGPSIERGLASDAGLCFIGRNSMCINEKYGSYFFIGYIVCDKAFEFFENAEKGCLNCGRCVEACPGGALNDGFDEAKCLSAITQKKGELTQCEKELVKNNNYIFGCDICQKVCPHNRAAEHTNIDAFCKNRIVDLDLNELRNMSNKEFKKKYGDRAFAWRGKNVLIRNMEIKEK